MRPGDRRRVRGRQGFTLIEVIVSLGVMTIGALGVIALQQHTIRSNTHARQLTLGMQLAQVWMERLKQDAHSWNEAGPPATVLNNTAYLIAIRDAVPNTFMTIPASDGFIHPNGTANVVTGSRGFDFRGNDLVLQTGVDHPNLYYCAAFRPAWVYFGRAMRVDVRVWWPREGFDMGIFDNCTARHGDLDPSGVPTTAYNQNGVHVVYLSTVIRMTPVLR
jgi:type IV pilus assembly protein PilV